jgi:hypothetical protein
MLTLHIFNTQLSPSTYVLTPKQCILLKLATDLIQARLPKTEEKYPEKRKNVGIFCDLNVDAA